MFRLLENSKPQYCFWSLFALFCLTSVTQLSCNIHNFFSQPCNRCDGNHRLACHDTRTPPPHCRSFPSPRQSAISSVGSPKKTQQTVIIGICAFVRLSRSYHPPHVQSNAMLDECWLKENVGGGRLTMLPNSHYHHVQCTISFKRLLETHL